MIMRSLLVTCGLLVTLSLSVGADVSPYPAWRLLTNGGVVGAAQRGQTIYFGGSFSKVGRGVTPFEGFLDPSTLTLTADPGCARDAGTVLATAEDGGSLLIDRGLAPFGSRLSDGAGPFVVGDEVRTVRVGSDCRFDRHFTLRLPAQSVLQGLPVYVGDQLYSAVNVGFPFPVASYVAAFDARTGDLRRGWPAPPMASLVGTGANGQLALTYLAGGPAVGPLTVGHFDPTTGQVTAAGVLPVESATVTLAGSRALVVGFLVENGQSTIRVSLHDLATWQALPAWPPVRTTSSIVRTVVADRRLVLAAEGLAVGGGASHAIGAFDLETGAYDTSWTAPEWLDDPASFVWHLSASGSRLVVAGDFMPGAPRDTIAALDVMTGALDAWEFPYAAASLVRRAGSHLYLGSIRSARRVARRYLAAVDAVTGEVLPWEPGASLPAADFQPVTAFVLDGAFVHAAHRGTVRRYDIGSGARDPAWRLDVSVPVGAGVLPGSVTRLLAGPGRIYATGDFEHARTGGVDPFHARSGGAALDQSGLLTAWNPAVVPRCYTLTRFPSPYPCIADAALTPERVFLHGRLTFPGIASRSTAAVSPETGALDLAVPDAFTLGFTASDGVLYAVVSLNGELRLARVDPGLRVSLLPERLRSGFSTLAVRNSRVYAGAEVDAATGAPTGNSKTWSYPQVADHGMLDAEFGSALAFHADLTGVPPGTPTDLMASVSGDRVTLQWTRASGDLQPLTPAPPAGGTAATSHLITASLTPGGPAIAQIDTASADTAHQVDAPPGVFFVRVMAKNAFGVSEVSNEVRVEVRRSAPDPPVATVATVVGREVRVRWQAPPGGWSASGYLLEAGTRAGASDIAIIRVDGLAFTAFGVPPGRYYVRVRAVNATGASAPGEEAVVDVGS